MEIWFIYALMSAFFSGIYVFSQKVSVERGYDTTLTSSTGMFLSSMMSLSVAVYMGGIDGWTAGVLVGGVVGVVFLIQTNLRLESLKYIDTAVFFPLYKTAAPLVTLVFGVLFFNEWFTAVELVGIMMGLFVPLLLLHKSEHSRQKNLMRGLVLLLLSALLAGVTAALSKYGATLLSTVFLFMAMSDGIGGSTGLAMFFAKRRHNIDVALKHLFDKRFLLLVGGAAFFQFAGYASILYGYKEGGSLAIVYTINSFYILIPIVLSIIVYKEHWNMRKAFAIGLSIVALAFLG